MVCGVVKGMAVAFLLALIVGILWFGLIKRLSPFADPDSYAPPAPRNTVAIGPDRPVSVPVEMATATEK
ncbi:MAG TPA: hypothetical protein HPP83_07140 [Candidatus Hydrogenedentes bacterium]|nr:hypothetical protein [Candidatus Hydrogenedentota bacterium]